MYQIIAIPALLSLVYSSVAGRIERTWISGSIVFAVIVVNARRPHGGPIAMAAVCTIILSILAHGISATPWARAFGRRTQGAGQGDIAL